MSEEVIELLGDQYDYDRMDAEYSQHLTLIPPEHEKVVKLLMEMIQKGQILIMDKESSVPMDASGIVGYKNEKIVIFCER